MEKYAQSVCLGIGALTAAILALQSLPENSGPFFGFVYVSLALWGLSLIHPVKTLVMDTFDTNPRL